MSVATTFDVVVQQAAGYEMKVIYCRELANSDPPAPDPTKPVDVTGWTARMQIRASIDGPILVDVSSATGGILVGGIDGLFTIVLSADQAAALTRGGVYDLLARSTAPGAQPERIVQGAVTIERAVTLTI